MDNVVDMTNKIGNRMIITHDDLDGVACAILYTKCFPKATVMMADVNEVDQLIVDMIAHDDFPVEVHLMISDLSLKEETIQELLSYELINEVEMIDHHWSAVERMKKYPWAFVDASFCAAKHMYNIYKDKFHIGDYEPFIELVDNYDRWGEGKGPNEDARNLADLFYFIGKETFYNRYLQIANVKLTTIELALLDIYHRQKAEYIAETIKVIEFMEDAEGNQFGIVFGDNYMNELGHHLLEAYPSIEYVCILNHRKAKISMRSRGKVNVGKIALECGGGGHSKAAGFPMTENPAQAYFLRFGGVGEEQAHYLEYIGAMFRKILGYTRINEMPEELQKFIKEELQYETESGAQQIVN